jgi:hypothetical protein
MDGDNYTLEGLFEQLGLDASDQGVDTFVRENQLDRGVRLEAAPCWNASQLAFLKEAREQDAQWSTPVDELDALLHKDSMG